MPDRKPDMVVQHATLPQAALLYRLSADLNPLHADPAVARAAGFDRPILHGLATFGVAGLTLMTARAQGCADTLGAISCHFSTSVFPGETILTDIWQEGDATLFRCTAIEPQTIVLDRGEAPLRLNS